MTTRLGVLAPRWPVMPALLALWAGGAGLPPPPAQGQTVIQEPTRVLTLVKGASLLLVNPVNIQRYTIGDPAVVEPVVVSPNELLLNGRAIGSTSLLLWEAGGAPKLYAVEVTVDAPALERYIRSVLPDEPISVETSGNFVTLSGMVKDPNSVERAVAIAQGTGATVIDNLVAPPAVQVLLQVRFAEVTRSGMKDFSSALSTLNPQDLNTDRDWSASTVSDGLVQVLLSNPNANIQGIIQAAISKGTFKSLAEPNLLTLPGKSASFLAGGEFPYPTVQGGGGNNAVSITFRDFGVKLDFTPYITRSGAIRLRVAPEVSSLDFANGLVLNGFSVPTIVTRKAATEVELREGQFLALAGLIDNTTTYNVTKIPILGDLPILGEFFKSRSSRERQTELLVLVTPRLIHALEAPPPLPTGEPGAWKWPGWMRREMERSQEQRGWPPPPPPPPAPPSLR